MHISKIKTLTLICVACSTFSIYSCNNSQKKSKSNGGNDYGYDQNGNPGDYDTSYDHNGNNYTNGSQTGSGNPNDMQQENNPQLMDPDTL